MISFTFAENPHFKILMTSSRNGILTCQASFPPSLSPAQIIPGSISLCILRQVSYVIKGTSTTWRICSLVSFGSPRSPQPLTVNFMPSLATSFRNAIGFTAGSSVGKSGLTYKQCFRLSHFILTMKEYFLKSGMIDYT